MPNDNYSIDFQVYRIDLSFFTREFLFQESAKEGVLMRREPFMQFVIDNKALIRVDSSPLISNYLICEKSAPHKQKSCTHARSLS